MTRITFKSKQVGLAMLAGCLLAGSLAAQAAAPTYEVPTMVVNYSDLDLSTEDGVHLLYKRISRAADRVCPYADSLEPARIAYSHACRDGAIARAVRDINSPQLAALRAEHAKHG